MCSLVRGDHQEVSRFFSPTWSLETDKSKRDALIKDVGVFLSKWLSISYSCSIETHTQANGKRRTKQIKNGAQLLELIVEDGGSTFEQIYCKDKHGSLSLDQRQKIETDRLTANKWMARVLNYCEDYRILLEVMDRECSKQRFIHLAYAVAAGVHTGYDNKADTLGNECAEPGYFIPEQIENNVYVGGFAKKLAKAIEEKVHDWLLKCEQSISTHYFDYIDASQKREETRYEMRRSEHVRTVLSQIISKHIAMDGFFADDLRTYQGSTLRASVFENLCNFIFDAPMQEQCEDIRTMQIRNIRLLGDVCSGNNSECSAHVAYGNRESLLHTLRNIPRVLRERPGFKNAILLFEMLTEIVRGAASHNLTIVAAQIVEWANKVGISQIWQLSQWIQESIKILQTQILPQKNFNNILPTLGSVCPPAPTWTDPAGAYESYMSLKANNIANNNKPSSLPKACTPIERSYLPMPRAVEQSLRLVSLVWELVGHCATYVAFFSPGHVMCSLVRQIIPLERVNTTHVQQRIRSWMEAYSLGQNYRNAVAELKGFRGSMVESDVREAVRCLSMWSLNDILSIAFEISPLFFGNEWAVLDSTLLSMGMENIFINAMHETKTRPLTTSTVRKALENACPVIFQIRNELRISPGVTSNELVEFLYSIPAIQRWKQDTDELVLTHEDVAAAGAHVPARLRRLSETRTLVHFGKRPKIEIHKWKHMRVYTFNGHDLRAALGPRT